MVPVRFTLLAQFSNLIRYILIQHNLINVQLSRKLHNMYDYQSVCLLGTLDNIFSFTRKNIFGRSIQNSKIGSTWIFFSFDICQNSTHQIIGNVPWPYVLFWFGIPSFTFYPCFGHALS